MNTVTQHTNILGNSARVSLSVARLGVGCKTIFLEQKITGSLAMDNRGPMDARFLAVVVVALVLMLALGYAIYP
jgi:hypothetical protein